MDPHLIVEYVEGINERPLETDKITCVPNISLKWIAALYDYII